jgi:hypothetical protein
VASQPLYQLNKQTNAVYEILPYEHFHYDSLQAQLQRRFSNGIQFQAGYTFSKWIGICCSTYGDREPNIPIPQYFNLNYALEPGDRTHVFHLTGIAELPFGKGKRLVQRGIGAALLGGWQLSGVFTTYSGAPFSVSANGASLNAPGSSQRADLVKSSVPILGGVGSILTRSHSLPLLRPALVRRGLTYCGDPGRSIWMLRYSAASNSRNAGDSSSGPSPSTSQIRRILRTPARTCRACS